MGAGGQARVVCSILLAQGYFNVVATIDIEPPEKPSTIFGIPIIGGDDSLRHLAKTGTRLGIVAIGNNAIRRAKYYNLLEVGLKAENAIHPSSHVSKSAGLQDGITIAPGAIVTTDVFLGANSIINSGAVIEHGSSVGKHSHIAPGAVVAGEVTIGEGAFVGIGAVLKERISIGTGAIIGAGSVILEDVPDNALVVGAPGKIIRFNSTPHATKK